MKHPEKLAVRITDEQQAILKNLMNEFGFSRSAAIRYSILVAGRATNTAPK